MDQPSKSQTHLLECGHNANLARLSARWLEQLKRSHKTGKINVRNSFCTRSTALNNTTYLLAFMWTWTKLKSSLHLATRWHMYQLGWSKLHSWVERKSEHSQWWFELQMMENYCHFKTYTKGRHRSLVHPNLRHLINTGTLLKFSGTHIYWSNMMTMKTFVNNILAPYFDAKWLALGLLPTQKALWQIDVWLVHQSEEFQGWMLANYTNIILDFIPGGCKGLYQPCNVGIQQPFKHSVKWSYHESVVEEMLKRMNEDLPFLTMDKCIKVLQDQSVK